MNNKEYTEAYLYWSAEGVDRTVEAFDRHLQAQEDRQTVEFVLNELRDTQNAAEGCSETVTVEELLQMYEKAVENSVNLLMGDHEYVEVQTLTGEDVRMVRTK